MDEHETVTTYVETTMSAWWINSYWEYLTEEQREYVLKQVVPPKSPAKPPRQQT